ncbi:hypothetical protein amb2555 [Paramagnetospirillum magneticum AMB-1]|uniref:Uncharacterized protein n=1 Tax=Paramagnetospirillum magneticum (strain ATCC 700264 / AMB-1) TaxID=342108 RepID=Q2W466_PARM1|nr:hypothetical protein amb2555 [Paramagnetospirillum magneticum AMB-1]
MLVPRRARAFARLAAASMAAGYGELASMEFGSYA